MAEELDIIGRKFFKKVHHVRNIRPDLDTRAHHLGDLAQVEVLRDGFFQPGLCQRIEGFGIHRLEILSIHPAELCVVKDRGRTSHAVVIKLVNELLQGENLAVTVGGPAEKGDKVDHGL